MIQTYQGYFRNGRFVSPELVDVPENVEVYVMVTGKELQPTKTKSQQQLEAFDKFISNLKNVKDESFTNEDFAFLENNRANLTREINL